ncbi:response regulator [Planctomycetota bacterium]
MTSEPPHILVLEDDAKYQNVVVFNLTHAGFKVTVASESSVALTLAENNHFDLVIVAYYLPDCPGTNFIRLLREDDVHRHVPVILLTACGVKLDEKYLREELAVLLMSKPRSMVELVDTVAESLAIVQGTS